MIWDFGILYLGISLAIAGWHLGLINSWPVPLAMVLATAVSQMVYVTAGVWLLDQTRLPADLAFMVGYVIVWILLEAMFEFVLLVLVPIKKRFFFNNASRAAGAAIGLSKTVAVLVFATAASVSAMNMPSPPHAPMIAAWVTETAGESVLLRETRKAASRMPDQITRRVVSEQSPWFAPTFADQSVLQVNKDRARKWRELFEGLHSLERDAALF